MPHLPTLDELHEVITDLEGQGHALAGRVRDAFDRVKTDIAHLVGEGESELDRFARSLVEQFVPELAKVKADIVSEVGAELAKLRGAANVVSVELGDAVAVLDKAAVEAIVTKALDDRTSRAGRR